MKFFLFAFSLIFIVTDVHALSLDNADIRLMCPQRGQIEVILHRYEHTQESWGKDNFETGGGHSRKGPLLLIQFANLDQMIFNQTNRSFSYWYADDRKLVNCRLLSLTGTFPINIPYYRE
ncbi:hypothetical protein MXL54_15165 [Enterobacteriaceae bacterium G50]|nr:hypothetical protein [Enterobacteriaceae bacterium G50]